jgi:hypothetical protein
MSNISSHVGELRDIHCSRLRDQRLFEASAPFRNLFSRCLAGLFRVEPSSESSYLERARGNDGLIFSSIVRLDRFEKAEIRSSPNNSSAYIHSSIFKSPASFEFWLSIIFRFRNDRSYRTAKI